MSLMTEILKEYRSNLTELQTQVDLMKYALEKIEIIQRLPDRMEENTTHEIARKILETINQKKDNHVKF